MCRPCKSQAFALYLNPSWRINTNTRQIRDAIWIEQEPWMFIKKPSDIPSSEITPRGLYLNRRSFIAGAGALAGAALAAHKLGNILTPSDTVMAGTKLDYGKSSYSTSDPETPFNDVTNYNNYYEFSTDKYLSLIHISEPT